MEIENDTTIFLTLIESQENEVVEFKKAENNFDKHATQDGAHTSAQPGVYQLRLRTFFILTVPTTHASSP